MRDRIVCDPQVCGGDPVLKGTRIPVYVVLEHLGAGDDHDTVLTQFPRLTREDILACLEYAEFLATAKALVA